MCAQTTEEDVYKCTGINFVLAMVPGLLLLLAPMDIKRVLPDFFPLVPHMAQRCGAGASLPWWGEARRPFLSGNHARRLRIGFMFLRTYPYLHPVQYFSCSR